MRRVPFAVSLALAGALLAGQPADAQESTTSGFVLGLHLSGASITPEDGDRSNAGGAGLFFGYGFNRTVQLFLQFDGAEFDVDDADIEGNWEMGHGDLGVRFHFANSMRSWVPYLQVALSGRAVGVDDAVVEGNPETDVGFYGGALSVGGGIMFYFNETLAADLQLIWSGGRFTEVEVDNVTIEGLEIDATSTRFNIGIVWWP
jgi:hypothetical protein